MTNLTREKRALLADQDWVTEDEADLIIGLRREREPGRSYTLEEVLRENGYELESQVQTIGPPRSSKPSQ